jgi:hypothetical protein
MQKSAMLIHNRMIRTLTQYRLQSRQFVEVRPNVSDYDRMGQ